MTVPARAGLPADPLVAVLPATHARILAWFPVPQLGVEVFQLVRAARDGATTRELATLFNITEAEALLLCLHHDVIPRRSTLGAVADIMRRTWLESSLPPGDR